MQLNVSGGVSSTEHHVVFYHLDNMKFYGVFNVGENYARNLVAMYPEGTKGELILIKGDPENIRYSWLLFAEVIKRNALVTTGE